MATKWARVSIFERISQCRCLGTTACRVFLRFAVNEVEGVINSGEEGCLQGNFSNPGAVFGRFPTIEEVNDLAHTLVPSLLICEP